MPVIEGHLLAQVAFVVFDMGRMSTGGLLKPRKFFFCSVLPARLSLFQGRNGDGNHAQESI